MKKNTLKHSSISSDEVILRLISFDPSLDFDALSHEIRSLELAMTHAKALLFTLPSTLDEVKRRSEPVSLYSLRVALFVLIDQDLLSTERADQIAPLARVIGLGAIEMLVLRWFQEERARMGRCDSASLRQQQARLERGLALLFHSPQGQSIFESLSGEERVNLSGPWVRPMMRLAPQELFPRHALLALFKSTRSSERSILIEQFERCRRRVGCPALPVYRLILDHLDVIELERVFGHLAANDELSQFKPLLSSMSERVQSAFVQAACSVSEVS